MRTTGLFAGIGGIELGLEKSGHEPVLLCELDAGASAVLRARFPGVPVFPDVCGLRCLPEGTDLVAAGFPCQDVSQAGMTAGIDGRHTGLIYEVFRLLGKTRVPWVLMENVPFMLQLGRGRAMEVIASTLEQFGYAWAYRIVDTRAFGIPQRRKRVYILASTVGDPRTVLFADDADEGEEADYRGRACGFYWTEGLRGLGWAVDAVPTLKGGSSVGIPSPPAIWLPDGAIVVPDIRDAERLQGFAADWTRPAEEAVRSTMRWKLVGNAVSVPVSRWIGGRLSKPGPVRLEATARLPRGSAWPNAAASIGGERRAYRGSHFPRRIAAPALLDFLRFPAKALSVRATVGFVSRLRKSGLAYPREFLDALVAHIERGRQGLQEELRLAYVDKS